MSFPPNDLSETFSSILYHVCDYAKQLENVTSIFDATMDEIDQRFFMSIDFLDYYKTYPRYPLDYKVIQNLGKYNLLAIYNIVQNDVKYLLDAIETPEILMQKSTMDKIPNSDIKRDYGLQLVYFSNISNDILEHGIYNGLAMDKTRRSYIYKTFGHYVSQTSREWSLICEYLIYIMLLKNMRNSLRIYESALSKNIYALRKNTSYIESFKNYINANKRKFSSCIIKYILEYTYKISNPSGTFLNEITNIVESKLSGLSQIFEDGVSIKDSITADLVFNASECIYNAVSAKFANSAASPDLKLIPDEVSDTLKMWELEDNYNPIVDKYSVQSFREYLYLVYYYKNSPRKFLNVLQLLIVSYVKRNMVDENISVFNPAQLISKFRQVIGTINAKAKDGINIDVLQKLLDQTITADYLKEVFDSQMIAEYVSRVGMVGCIEDVFSLDSPDFEKYIDDLYETIFNYLKDTVQVEPYYEYYFNRKMLYWYLLGYIKRDILKNLVFTNEENILRKIVHDILEDPEYKIRFDIERMRSRASQYIEGNIVNITNLFDNVLETAVEKKLHTENISYFFS